MVVPAGDGGELSSAQQGAALSKGSGENKRWEFDNGKLMGK